MFARLLAGMGSRSQRRHGGIVPAGRARSLRLPHGMLLAGAGARPVESRARLDREVRRGAKGLAKDRSDLPRQKIAMKKLLTFVFVLGSVSLLAQAARPLAAPVPPGGNRLIY